jgi:VanZ family protein
MIIKLLLAHKNKISVLAIAYTILLLYLSLDTVDTKIDLPSQSDKVFHALAYFLFTMLWFLVIYTIYKSSYKKAIKITLLFAFLFGILVEFLQHFLTLNRQGDLVDVFANTLGILFAALVVNYFISKTVKS